jgi:methylenetetrahydrofolate dehydrogenase (NADP+)/methenyltetrahydrofolate cyclohydrolase
MQTLSSDRIIPPVELQLKHAVADLIDQDCEPHLAVVLVGNHEESLRYVRIKSKKAKELGIILSLYHLEADTPIAEIQQTVRFLAQDSDVHGIILQLPLPETVTPAETEQLLKEIPPDKDVDGLTGAWQGELERWYRELPVPAQKERREAGALISQALALSTHFPPMIRSVTSLLAAYDLPFTDRRTVMVGAGRLVGAPLTAFLSTLEYAARSVDEETPKIFDITTEADILVTGTGVPNLITYQWIKPDAVVVDCAGDVHHDSVEQVASAVSPARGGIGPLTVTWLMYNVVQAAKVQCGAAPT